MTKEELAAQLDGREYRHEITEELEAQAQKAGLVLVFGASDALMEMRGAIFDEVDAFGGTEILITKDGIFEENLCESMCIYYERAKAEAEAYGVVLKALWHDESPSWTYETAIPHASFEIVEDGEPYCRGIVFGLTDVGRG